MKVITFFLVGIIIGSLAMYLFLINDLKPIKAFGRCLEQKTEHIDSYSYLPTMAVSECANQYLQ